MAKYDLRVAVIRRLSALLEMAMLRLQSFSSLLIVPTGTGTGMFELSDVMQSLPKRFYDQTDQRVCKGIRS